jgi:hypothetical protein
LIATLEAAAVDIFAALDRRMIDALILKGAGLARLLYTPEEHRRYVDIDLLVSPLERVGAEEVLAGLGYRNATEQLGIDDIGGVVHADTWLGTPRGAAYQIVVELHRWLPGARVEPAAAWNALWRRRTSIELGERPIPVPARDAQALQLATHAAQHGPQYSKGLRELTLAIDRWPVGVWQRAGELAVEIDATATFAAGLRLVPAGMELVAMLTLPADVALEWEIRHRDERPRGAFHLEAFRAAQSPAERLAVVRRALAPDRRWIVNEYRWVDDRAVRLVAAYALHILRAPLWLAKAWWFSLRARRAT